MGGRDRIARAAGDVVRRAVDRGGRPEVDRRRPRRRALGAVARKLARLARELRRRRDDGTARGTLRRARDSDLRRRVGLHRALHLDPRRSLAALCRPRPVRRPARQRRPQRAALCLCQPLVRSPPRLRARAVVERALSRRNDLAADLRARHRQFRLAQRPCWSMACSSPSWSFRWPRCSCGRRRSCASAPAQPATQAKRRRCSAGHRTWCSRCSRAPRSCAA